MITPIKALIIDDEPLARQRLENLLKDVSEIELIGLCSTGKEAVLKIKELNPDIVFLDIQMKDMTGFDVLEKLSITNRPLVIFVTAYDEYALKAFDNFAFDYLLKPFKDERFFKSTSNVIAQLNQNNTHYQENLNNLLTQLKNPLIQKSDKSTNTIPVKLGNKISFLKLNDIKYILASGYYAEIYTENKKHLIRESLTKFVMQLNSNDFIRIHRSTIINLKYVQELISSNYGDMDVKMKDNKLFRISKSYKKEFLKQMGL